MTKINRVTAKIFGETALTTGNDPEIGQFGSGKAGTYIGTGDIATIQALAAWSNGWIDAVTPSQQFPALPEMTGVHKVLSQQIAYLLKEGIPEYDAGTTYEKGAVVKSINDTTVNLYSSIIDENTGNALNNTAAWLPWGYVLKTGDTMSGNLEIGGSSDPILSTQSNSVQYNVAPGTSSTYGHIRMNDINEQWMGLFGVERYTDNRTIVKMQGRDASGSNARIQLISNGAGVWYAQCPASDAVGSIVTTAGINKSGNGYLRFGNGLLLQWGSKTGWGTVNLPTAFSNTSYSVVITPVGQHGCYENAYVDTLKTTTFYANEVTDKATSFKWYAIGY